MTSHWSRRFMSTSQEEFQRSIRNADKDQMGRARPARRGGPAAFKVGESEMLRLMWNGAKTVCLNIPLPVDPHRLYLFCEQAGRPCHLRSEEHTSELQSPYVI